MKRRWLIESRKLKEFTQEVVAQKVNISRSYYAEIERGNKTPSGKIAVRIARVLDVPPEKFFE